MKKTKFHNIYERGKRFYTPNLTPGKIFFEEETERSEGKEYRQFDARRSKLGAAIAKGISQTGLKEGDTVLYLGASHGYTVSFVSDIVGKKGFIFAVDFAPRVVRDLVFLCEKRENITPVMADANQPDKFSHRIHSIDFVFMDVAQKNQGEIFIKNCRRFLKKEGFGILAVKSRSMDITKKPKQVYQEVRQKLEKELTVVDFKTLDPFEKDHCVFVVKNKK